MKDWVPEIEKQSQADIVALQEKKLQEVLAYVNEHSAFYKRLFKEHNINVSAIKTLPAKMICNVITMLSDVYLNQLL